MTQLFPTNRHKNTNWKDICIHSHVPVHFTTVLFTVANIWEQLPTDEGTKKIQHQFSSGQSLRCVRLFATPWIAARQASLSITNSRTHSNSHPSSPWCHPAISSSVVPFSSFPQSLPASESFPTSQLFAWGGQSFSWSFSFSIIPSKEIPGLISFRMDWLDLLAVISPISFLIWEICVFFLFLSLLLRVFLIS